MEFKKGHEPWNKGKPLSEETKKKLSLALKGKVPWIKGKHHSEEAKRKNSEAHRGKKLSEETKRKIREALKNVSYWKGKKFSKEHRKNMSEARKGLKRTKEHNENISKALVKAHATKDWGYKKGDKVRLGIKHTKDTKNKIRKANLGKPSHWSGKKRPTGKDSCNWKGGLTPENKIIRNSIDFRLWREAVFARDNWTCQKYGIRGGKLCSHHIKNFAQYPELRFAIDNGITFSKKAHDEFHKTYGRNNNTKKQLEIFLTIKLKEEGD